MLALSLSTTRSRSISDETDALAICADCDGDCRDACFNDAIVSIEGSGVRIEEEFCAGCGACVAACGQHLLRLVDGLARIGAKPR